jgi:nitrogen fixation protein NifB
MRISTDQHPCFNRNSAKSCGRVHLPVAPRCNIQCNYCNRKYDCVNESRPGVASAVLKPHQAVEYMRRVLDLEPAIRVAGIAGPGDPLANPAETLETLRLMREHFPHLLFCLSTNGLGASAHLDDLAALGVTHATVTLNTVDPEIGARIYSFVRDGNVLYRGRAGAELLLSRQLEAIRGFAERGILVKVNTIVLPGINDAHLLEVARTARDLGATLMNLVPLHPTADTPFATLAEPSREVMASLRDQAGVLVPQMTHCRRCRADAVGLLGQDRSMELAPTLASCAKLPPSDLADRPYVAVATREGMLVNQHLGEAKSFQIWGRDGNGGFRLAEERQAPPLGCGPSRWEDLARTLRDCRAVLCAALGDKPRAILQEHGLTPVEGSGFIEEALSTVYSSGNLDSLRGRRKGLATPCCGAGGGEGC